MFQRKSTGAQARANAAAVDGAALARASMRVRNRSYLLSMNLLRSLTFNFQLSTLNFELTQQSLKVERSMLKVESSASSGSGGAVMWYWCRRAGNATGTDRSELVENPTLPLCMNVTVTGRLV